MTMNDEMIEIRAEFIDYKNELKRKIEIYEQIINFLGLQSTKLESELR